MILLTFIYCFSTVNADMINIYFIVCNLSIVVITWKVTIEIIIWLQL